VLKACGLYGVALTLGSTDPEELELSERERERQWERERLMTLYFATGAALMPPTSPARRSVSAG
jgi:hypothetical protein